MDLVFHDVVNIKLNRNRYEMSHMKSDVVKCSTCIGSKQTRASADGCLVENFPNTTINADLCGPVQIKTLKEKGIS